MCNVPECQFDGLDCVSLPFIDPWKICPFNSSCRQHFLDGVCNVECNRAECLFDGGDCQPAVPACQQVDQCRAQVEDGYCEPDCNTPQCPFDGLDCSQPEDLVSAEVVFSL